MADLLDFWNNRNGNTLLYFTDKQKVNRGQSKKLHLTRGNCAMRVLPKSQRADKLPASQFLFAAANKHLYF
jgi:hypothetical protein